jgi:hypothetical protein
MNKMIEQSQLDFAREAAINLTLKRVQRELDEVIKALEKEGLTQVGNGVRIAKLKLADLTVEQIEEGN